MTIKKPGYHKFTDNLSVNFMLNRLSWDISEGLLWKIGKKVSSNESFVEIMLDEAHLAESENRYWEAGFFYRAAEFYLEPGDLKKTMAYEKFMEYFYKERPNAADQYKQIDHAGGKIGLIDIPAKGKQKDILLCCSGFDGLIEELYEVGLRFADQGYRVVLFEGQGQGSSLRRYHIPMTHDWETAVAAVLDDLIIESCTLIGLSLGGYLAPRAAAHESRVKRVVIWGAMHDFTAASREALGQPIATIMYKLIELGFRKTINRLIKKKITADPALAWGVNHGMHTSGQTDPYGFLKWTMDFNLDDCAEDIDQDVIILMGHEDHLVPAEQMRIQAAAMTNAKSITTRLITAKEHGAQHCQIGNPDLVIDEIVRWMTGLDTRDQLCAGREGVKQTSM